MINTIVLIGGVAGALTAIIVLTKHLVGLCKAGYAFFNDIKKDVKTLIDHDKSQYLAILRLTVTADHMPISERLLAGKEYVERGGNGEVSKLYKELKEKCQQATDEE